MDAIRPEQTYAALARDFTHSSSRIERLHAVLADSQKGLHINLEDAHDAALFHWQKIGMLVVQLAEFWVLQARVGVPKGGHATLDQLRSSGHLEIDVARKLRYISEYRNLSTRERERIDPSLAGHDPMEEIELVRNFFEAVALDLGFKSQGLR